MDTTTRMLIAEREAVLSGIRDILVLNLDVRREPDEIDPDTPLFGSGLGLDSVDAVELSLSVENAFDVRLPGGVASRAAMRTVNTLADFVLTERERGSRS